MPRRPRIIVPNMPHHIVQRGHNRNAVFVERGDYEYYLENLAEWKEALGLNVYSYCLMTNHIHLVVESSDDPGDIGRLMKRLAGRQTRYVNKQEKRTGSLWESRYKISPIQSDAYLLQCCRYVELNPVKARMVSAAEAYEWSSYAWKLGLVENVWMDKDLHTMEMLSFENGVERYKNFVESSADAQNEHAFIAAAVERNQLTGCNAFIDEVEQRLGLRIEYRGRGRPKRSA